MIKKTIIVLLGINACYGVLDKEQEYKWRRWAHKSAENIAQSIGSTAQKALEISRKNSQGKAVTPPRDQFLLDLYAGKRVAIPAGAINEARTVKFTKAEFNATPLIAAVLGGYVHVMEYLLKRGANPNGRNKDGLTPLHLAARSGATLAVYKLFDFKADPNLVDKVGMTPLMYAVMRNKNNDHLPVIKLLVSHGADVTLKNRVGKSALDYAQAKGDAEVIQLLKPKSIECDYDEELDDYVCHFGVPGSV